MDSLGWNPFKVPSEAISLNPKPPPPSLLWSKEKRAKGFMCHIFGAAERRFEVEKTESEMERRERGKKGNDNYV